MGVALGAAVGWSAAQDEARARAKCGRTLATLQERLAGKEAELQKLQDGFNNEVAEHKNRAGRECATEGRARRRTPGGDERRESFKQAADELSEKFKALSRDALKDNSQSFLRTGPIHDLESFRRLPKAISELRTRAIDQLVKPLKESLDKVDGKIGELEKTRAGAYSELREQVKSTGDFAIAAASRNRKPGEGLCARHTFAAVGARFSCGAWWNSRACCSTATSSSRKQSPLKTVASVPI